MRGILLSLAAFACLSVQADAQDALPPHIADLYRAYVAAQQSGDAELAFGSAQAVYSAAVEADLDPITRASLAESVGIHALQVNENDIAYAHWREAAELSRANGDAGLVAGWRWHHAAMSMMRAGDAEEAARCSNRAIDELEEVDQLLATNPSLYADAYYLNTELRFQRGQFRRLRRPAHAAVDGFEAQQAPASFAVARSFFFAGLGELLRREHEEAAYYLHLSADAFEQFDPQGENAVYTYGLSRLAAGLADTGWRDPVRGENAREWRRSVEIRERMRARLSEHRFFLASSQGEGLFPETVPEGATPPQRINDQRSDPQYPFRAANAGVEGLVILKFDVTPAGEPENVEVAFALPTGFFEEATLEAIERTRYEPAMLDGEPIAATGHTAEYQFQLGN